jgi:hypothetical protein
VDEKLLLPVTSFQLRYLESVLTEPGEDEGGWTTWTVPKEALTTFMGAIQTIYDYVQSLADADDESEDEDSGPERKLLDRKAVEIGMLHESFKDALGSFDDFDIKVKPIDQVAPGETGHYLDLVYVSGLYMALFFLIGVGLIERLTGILPVEVWSLVPWLLVLVVLVLSVQALRAVYRIGLRTAIAAGLVGIVLYVLSYQVFNTAASALFGHLFPVTPVGA